MGQAGARYLEQPPSPARATTPANRSSDATRQVFHRSEKRAEAQNHSFLGETITFVCIHTLTHKRKHTTSSWALKQMQSQQVDLSQTVFSNIHANKHRF